MSSLMLTVLAVGEGKLDSLMSLDFVRSCFQRVPGGRLRSTAPSVRFPLLRPPLSGSAITATRISVCQVWLLVQVSSARPTSLKIATCIVDCL